MSTSLGFGLARVPSGGEHEMQSGGNDSITRNPFPS